MEKQSLIIAFLFHLTQAAELAKELDSSDLKEYTKEFGVSSLFGRLGHIIESVLDAEQSPKLFRKRIHDSFSNYSLNAIMTKLRMLVLSPVLLEGAAEIDWLLRVLLMSPRVFQSTKELDNFLANMTGSEHQTKSTGRDRIVDWYLRQVRLLPLEERDKAMKNIAKHIFISLPSNYSEWNALLYGDRE